MVQIAERKATVFYKGDGVTSSFTFSFRYLQKKFVKVKILSSTTSTLLVYGVDYTVEDFKVILKVAPVSGVTIGIYRETPTDSEVEWVDGSTLRAYDMNKFEIQLLHISEENMDKIITDSMVYDGSDNAWEGNNRRIKDIAQPTSDNDAVNLAYLNSVGVAKQQTVVEAVSLVTAAKESANTSETNAKASETNAKASETNAKASESAAGAYSDTAGNYATSARLLADTANAAATDAAASKTECQRIETALATKDLSNYETIEAGLRSLAARPNCYEADTEWSGDNFTITSPTRMLVNINNGGYVLTTQKTIDITKASSWDSTSASYVNAAARAGKDFYVFACIPTTGYEPAFVLSVNSTVPAGYTADNSRKIAGFHCLCLNVGTIAGHPLSGYITGSIIPTSVWCLSHRAESSNEGMVYDKNTDMWVDIYLNSYTGTTAAKTIRLQSTFGGVIADGTSAEKFHWFKGVDVLMLDKKTLPTQREFMSLAKGSNEGTNIAGSADPNTTGGHTDTAGRRMISNIGCEDCCGVLWQWGIEGGGGNTGGAWQSAFDANDFSDVRGQQYQEPCRSLLGANWSNAGLSGSRASVWNTSPLTVDASFALRGVSRSRKVI